MYRYSTPLFISDANSWKIRFELKCIVYRNFLCNWPLILQECQLVHLQPSAPWPPGPLWCRRKQFQPLHKFLLGSTHQVCWLGMCCQGVSGLEFIEIFNLLLNLSLLLPKWLLFGVKNDMLRLHAPWGIVVIWVLPGGRWRLVNRPDTRRHVELSPLHTPHWSYRDREPTTPSQPST